MNLPNNLTLLRILLVPVLVATLLYYPLHPVFCRSFSIGVFALACLTDALDGYLARKLNQKTVLGSYLDPIADKLLLLTGFLSLSFMLHLPEAMQIPAWVTIAVVTRDAVIVIGAALIFILTGSLKAEPLFISKLTTFFQMAALFAALLGLGMGIRFFFFNAAVALTAISGVMYVRLGSRILESAKWPRH